MTRDHNTLEGNSNRYLEARKRKEAARKARDAEVDEMMRNRTAKKLALKKEKEIKKNKQIEEMIFLLERGCTLDEIGKFNGFTRERVRQICTSNTLYNTLYKEALRKCAEKRHEKVIVKKTCLRCGKEFELRISSKNKGFFCGVECSRYTPDERATILRNRMELNKTKARIFYHTVFKKRPDFVDINKKRNTEYRNKPGVSERLRKEGRKRYYEMKADPVRYAAHLEKSRKYFKERYWKKKLST